MAAAPHSGLLAGQRLGVVTNGGGAPTFAETLDGELFLRDRRR